MCPAERKHRRQSQDCGYTNCCYNKANAPVTFTLLSLIKPLLIVNMLIQMLQTGLKSISDCIYVFLKAAVSVSSFQLRLGKHVCGERKNAHTIILSLWWYLDNGRWMIDNDPLRSTTDISARRMNVHDVIRWRQQYSGYYRLGQEKEKELLWRDQLFQLSFSNIPRLSEEMETWSYRALNWSHYNLSAY